MRQRFDVRLEGLAEGVHEVLDLARLRPDGIKGARIRGFGLVLPAKGALGSDAIASLSSHLRHCCDGGGCACALEGRSGRKGSTGEGSPAGAMVLSRGRGWKKRPARNEWDGYGSEGLAASYRFGLSTIWPGRWLASFWGDRVGPCGTGWKTRRHKTTAPDTSESRGWEKGNEEFVVPATECKEEDRRRTRRSDGI